MDPDDDRDSFYGPPTPLSRPPPKRPMQGHSIADTSEIERSHQEWIAEARERCQAVAEERTSAEQPAASSGVKRK